MVNISISTNVLIVISCLILLCVIGSIIYIIYKDKKIDQAEIDDLLEDIVNAKPRKEEVEVKQIDPVGPPKMDLEQMLEVMQEDLDKKEKNKIEIFEEEQENNAIISYKELLKAADKVEKYEKEQEENAIISYKELNESIKNLQDKEDELQKPIKKAIAKIESPRENKDKKFKSTEFISPIYGKMKENIEYPKIKATNKNDDLSINSYFGEELKKEDTLEKILSSNSLNDELKKNDEFLKALKEFRNNL